jgi:hypothetical protein
MEKAFIFSPGVLALLSLALWASGFGLAVWMKYPRHILQAGWYRLLGKAPRCIGVFTRDNVFDVEVRPRDQLTTKTNKAGYIPLGSSHLIFGKFPGYFYYERCLTPLRLDSPSLEKGMREPAEHINADIQSKNIEFDPEVGYRVISADYATLYYETRGNVAARIAEARVRKKAQILLVAGVVVSALTFVTALYLAFNLQNITKFLTQLIAILQQGGYGIK